MVRHWWSSMAAMAAATPVVLARTAMVYRTSRRPSVVSLVRPAPGIDPRHDLTAGPGATYPGDGLVEEPSGPPCGVGRPFTEPGVEHFAGVGPGRQDRVVAQHLGVSERRALLLFPSTSQIVESRSITSRAAPGPAPNVHPQLVHRNRGRRDAGNGLPKARRLHASWA
jgi:hypothetical protein